MVGAEAEGCVGNEQKGLRTFQNENIGDPGLSVFPVRALMLDNLGHSYFRSVVEPQDRLWLMAVGTICHWDCGYSLSNPGVIYIVSTGKGQVSAGATSKGKAIPWKLRLMERGSE